MTLRRALPLAVTLLAALACSPRLIPGTEVKDTKDNRAIYDVVDAYVKAMNARDAAAVLALVAPDYFDDAGTPEPGDDLDRPRLEKSLAQDLSRVETTRLSVSIRKIETQDATGFAEIFYDSYYRVQTPAGPIARRDTDVHRIRLKREGGKWLIVAGL
jgi:ketosteroid isomerase-like protein